MAPGSCSGLHVRDADRFPPHVCVPLQTHRACGEGGVSAQALPLIFHLELNSLMGTWGGPEAHQGPPDGWGHEE